MQKQMFLLKQLRAMLTGEEPDAASNSATQPADKSASPQLQQLQQLKSMFEKFGGSIPPGMMPKPEDISPELIQKVQSDPNMRRMVQQMLEEYKRTGELPAGNNGGGFRMPLPPGLNSQRPNEEPSDGKNTNGAARPPATDNRIENKSPSRPTTPGSPADEADEMPGDSSRKADALKRLEDLWNESKKKREAEERSGTPSPQGGNSQNNGRPPSNSQQSGNSRRNTSEATPPGDWGKFLEDLIQKQRGDETNPARSRNSSAGSGSLPPSYRGDQIVRNGQPNGGGNTGNELRLPDGFSIEKFLEDMKDVVPADLPPFNSPARSRTTNQGGREKQKNAEAVQAEAEAARELLREKKEAASEILKQQGIKEALRSIVRDTRQNDPQAKDAEGNSAPGVQKSLSKAMKGISKDLFKMLKDGDISLKAPDPAPKSPEQSGPSPSEPPPAESAFGGMLKSTGEIISEIASPPPIEPPSAAAASSETPNLPTQPDAASADSPSELPLTAWAIPLLLLALIAALFAWRSGLLENMGIKPPVGRALGNADIRSKADVVRAFHRMALHPARTVQEWWTHQMVTKEIAQTSPEQTYQVGVLSELYEQARYLPDDEEFTPEQIQEARQAIQRCEVK